MNNHVDKKNVLELEDGSGKKAYVGPVLIHQAHLRDITLAPSDGTYESGLGGGWRGNGVAPANSPDNESNASGGIFENDIFEG